LRNSQILTATDLARQGRNKGA